MSVNTRDKPKPRPPEKARLFGVRLPVELLAALHRRAAEDRRTITTTAEIVIAAGLAATAKRGRPTSGKIT